MKKNPSVLILFLDKHIGDFINSISTLENIQNYYQKNIFFAIDESHQQVVNATNLKNIIYYPRSAIETKSIFNKSKHYFKFLSRLRSLKPDLVFDIGGSVASTYITRLTGCKRRIGPLQARNSWLYTEQAPQDMSRLRSYHYSDIINFAGISSQPTTPRLNANEQADIDIKSFFMQEKIDKTLPIVVVHTGAGKAYKQWSTKSFSKVIHGLLNKNCQVIIIGTKEDNNRINQVLSFLQENKNRQRLINACGKHNLTQLIALFQASDLFFGNDCGPMHLACASNARVITLFGPTRDEIWGPFSDKATIIKGKEGCGDCPRKTKCIYNYRCINSIDPEQVLDTIIETLNA